MSEKLEYSLVLDDKMVKNGTSLKEIKKMRTWLLQRFKIRSGFAFFNDKISEKIHFSLVNIDQAINKYKKMKPEVKKTKEEEFRKKLLRVNELTEELQKLGDEITQMTDKKENKKEKKTKNVEVNNEALPELN